MSLDAAPAGPLRPSLQSDVSRVRNHAACDEAPGDSRIQGPFDGTPSRQITTRWFVGSCSERRWGPPQRHKLNFRNEADGIRTRNIRIDSPVLSASSNTPNSSNHNDLALLHSDSRRRRAAKCAAILEIEAWILGCPVPLTAEQRATIVGVIHKDTNG